jgi:integrase/recombinase XerC
LFIEHEQPQRQWPHDYSLNQTRIVKTAFISAGFDSPRLTAHSTRHTAATLSLLKWRYPSANPGAVLRHRNIGTTEIYAHNIDATTNPAANDVEEAIFGKSL